MNQILEVKNWLKRHYSICVDCEGEYTAEKRFLYRLIRLGIVRQVGESNGYLILILNYHE